MWQRIKKSSWHWRGVLITTPAISTMVWLLRLSGILQVVEFAAYDQFLRWRPQDPIDERITIVAIDQGHKTQSDGDYAKLLSELQGMGAGWIGLDIYRDIPVQPGHAELTEVFQNSDNIIGIEKIIGDTPAEKVGGPPVLKEKGLVAFNDLLLDSDGKTRRSLLTVTDDDGSDIYSFAFTLAYYYLTEKEGVTIDVVPGEPAGVNWFQLGDKVLEPINDYTGSYIRQDADGYQLLTNFRGKPGSFNQVTMAQVLAGEVNPDLIKDRIIVIGDITEVNKDLFSVPYTLTADKRMPGVEIHANMLSQLLDHTLNDRPLMQSWSEWQEWLWVILWTGIGASLTWGLRNTGKSKAWSWERFIGLGGAIALLIGGSYGAMFMGWWLPVVPSVLGLSLSAIAITGSIARSAGQIRNTFGRYLSNEIVSTLLESPEGLKLGGERRTITILTSDLRGFTGTSERLPPEEVVKILNIYLSDIADVITDYTGTIDEFMGDGILVLFGAPLPREDDPERAIACAIAMQLALGKVNKTITEMGLAPFEMGVGVNTGEVVVGNIGSEKRAKYGVVGSQVNLTYRIESYTTGGQVLISENTYELLKDVLEIGGTQQVSPKGVKTAITIYEVLGIHGKYNLHLPKIIEEFYDLPEAIAIEFSALQGKDIVEERQVAHLTRLSERQAVLKLENVHQDPLPAVLSNLKLNFQHPYDETLEDDFYAKVIKNEDLATPYFHIQFTMRPPQINNEFTQVYEQAKTSSEMATST